MKPASHLAFLRRKARHSLRVFAMGTAMALSWQAEPAQAEQIISEKFDDTTSGKVPSDGDGFTAWRGPEGNLYGSIGVTEEYAPGGLGKALVFRDTSPAASTAPILEIAWKDSAPATGHLIVEWKWMVPVDAPSLSCMFLGKDWVDAAAIILLENGSAVVQYGKGDKREMIGKYSPGEWHTVRFDLDIKERTFDLALDGTKMVNGYPWQEHSPATVSRLSILSDAAENDRAGEAVLALDDISVNTVK